MIWHEPSPKSVLKFGTISTPLMYEISARNHHNFNAKIQDSAQQMLEIVLNFNLSCKTKNGRIGLEKRKISDKFATDFLCA